MQLLNVLIQLMPMQLMPAVMSLCSVAACPEGVKRHSACMQGSLCGQRLITPAIKQPFDIIFMTLQELDRQELPLQVRIPFEIPMLCCHLEIHTFDMVSACAFLHVLHWAI